MKETREGRGGVGWGREIRGGRVGGGPVECSMPLLRTCIG